MPTIAPDRYVVGGCRIVFAASGYAAPVGSADKPCIGVRSVGRSATGDLDVRLTPQSSQAAIRLLVTPSTQMVERGIVAGAGGGRDVVTLCLYDDTAGTRVDLRTGRGRARVAGTAVHVGWTKAGAPAAPGAETLGVNALGSHRDRSATSGGTVPGGCVLRISTTGVRVHANETHRCIGVRTVGISSTGRIRVDAAPGTVAERGCSVDVSGINEAPRLTSSFTRLCTGVTGVWLSPPGGDRRRGLGQPRRLDDDHRQPRPHRLRHPGRGLRRRPQQHLPLPQLEARPHARPHPLGRPQDPATLRLLAPPRLEPPRGPVNRSPGRGRETVRRCEPS